MEDAPFQNCIFKTVGDKTVVMDLNTANYYSLNKTAHHIVRLLQKGKGFDEIAKSTARAFSISPLKAKKDVKKLILQLKRAGLLTSKPK